MSDGAWDAASRSDSITVSNEFALAEITKVVGANGQRLEIVAPKVGRRVYLDAIHLEMLTALTPSDLTALIARTTRALPAE